MSGRLRGIWKPALALVIGLALGLALPLAWSVWHAHEPASQFELAQDVPSSGEGLASALYQSLGVELVGGHEVTLLDNGRVFDALVEDIGRARTSVDIVMYIWERGAASDRVTAALVARARAGVACRLVIDAFGSSAFERDVAPPLTAAGCDVRMFRQGHTTEPLARDHRKIIVVDGTVAFTGGLGVRDNWLGDGVHDGGWRDTNVRFTGPAVRAAQQAFAENWQEAGGALLGAEAFPAPTATGSSRAAFVASTASPVLTRAERLMQLAIVAAKHRLWIVNAYFAPSPGLVALIERQAKRGIDVRLLVPGIKSDSKPSLAVQHKLDPELLAAGVRVWEYTPVMIHSKTVLVDDQLSVVSSINLDPLSLGKLEEDALVIEDAKIAAELGEDFTRDCTHAEELHR